MSGQLHSVLRGCIFHTATRWSFVLKTKLKKNIIYSLNIQPETSNVFSQVDKDPETECENPSTAEDAAPPTTHNTESDSKQVLKNPQLN